MRITLPDDDAALLAGAGIREPRDPAAGLFPADAWLRRVSGEGAVVFGGGRALLLEVAHPLVAAGVARHSRFRSDPFGRLQRTLEAMSAITFGDRDSALAAARSVERAHTGVRGVLGQAAGPFPASAVYDARDPSLVWWVWATLADTALVVYEHLVGPLTDEAKDAYHADHAGLARLLGVPADALAPGWAGFRRQFDAMLDSDALTVTDEAREIAQAVLAASAEGGGRVALMTTALLPPRLRAAFGLPWDDDRAARFEALCASVRRLRRDAPPALDGSRQSR